MGQNRFIILGMFVILAMGMFFYLAFKVGYLSTLQGMEVTVLFDDATGLKEGGDVKIKGVDFGKISALQYQGDKAVVKIRLVGDIEVPGDVAARIRPETLLGESFLELLIPPDSTAAPIQAGHVITDATKAMDINQFVDRMGHFIDQFEATDFSANLGTVVKTLADNSGRMESMIQNLDKLAVDAKALISENKTSLERTVANLDRITTAFGKNAPKTADNLNQILARLDKLTADLESASPDLAADLGQTMKNLSEASEDLPATLKEFHTLSQRLQETLNNVDQFLIDDVEELKDIIERRGIKARVRIW
jgi:phospholipid/cholesterol/gamma-HCH transport system substrate-binding protein